MIRCPVCEFPGLTVPPYKTWPPPQGLELRPPYVDQLGAPSYDVCPSCGFEFGNDDDPGLGLTGDSFESWREQWEAEGRPWFDDTTIPEDYFDQEGLRESPE